MRSIRNWWQTAFREKGLLRIRQKDSRSTEREKETDHIRRKVEEQKQKLLGKKNEIKKKK